ncbi:hypothetical protein SUGI_1060390 [Cryptomeria japonica]|nr:hypothetical protein SUGI_1060390 [Cryptomeria japonica]
MEVSTEKRCMNVYCGEVETTQWRNGWLLRSGNLAHLCNICGNIYEMGCFCIIFHQNEDGWTHCTLCHKTIHCGCIASASSLLFSDKGGVQCDDCAVPQENSNILSSSTQQWKKSKKEAWEALEMGEFVFDSNDSLPNVVMIEGIEFEEYRDPPVFVMRGSKGKGKKGEGDRIVDSSGIETTKHVRHRDGCRCVVCTQHPKGNPHPQNCKCRGCTIYLKRRESALRRISQKRSPTPASMSNRGRPKNRY